MSGWRVGPGLIPGFAVSRDTPGGGGQEKEGPEKTTLQRTPSPNPRGGGGPADPLLGTLFSQQSRLSLSPLAW